jgi:REP element-mobilizing transposase RayT
MTGWVHLPVRSARGRPLFEDWAEALLLWQLLTARGEVIAVVLMPDHIHVLCRVEDLPIIRRALTAYARMRNARRGEGGQVWRRREDYTEVRGAKQLNRVVAYVHRNPVLSGLVAEPLAWPFSTHRDAMGLAIPRVRRMTQDPQRLHEQVCLIPGQHNEAVRPLPCLVPDFERLRALAPVAVLREIRAAVSALTRTPVSMLQERGPARSLLLRSARCLTQASAREIAEFARVSHSTALRAPEVVTPEVTLVERVLGDDRFRLLDDGDLRRIRRS